MMQRKLYLLLAILLVFVICSTSADQKPRKSDYGLDSKKKVGLYEKYDDYDKDKEEKKDAADDEVDYGYSALGSYAKDRYTAYDKSEDNYRTRPRWSASPPQNSYDDSMNGNDWSRSGYGNAYPPSAPYAPYDSNPTCTSLMDPRYPIFSDTCGAVPQARYSLPNAFGHRDRWQIAQLLTALMSTATDPTCTRSLRLLLCPVLFPPCPSRHEPPPVLPCQAYCRVVKARCAMPILDFLPCEILPRSSDLCPINQPYGSFMPPGAFPSVPMPFPMTGELSSSNYPTPLSFPSLQSLFSQQGPQSAFPSSPLPSPFSPSAQSVSPLNLYNGGPYATDSLTSMFDFPSRQYTNDYQQISSYAPPSTRSSTEIRPTSEMRSTSEARSRSGTRSSAGSSVVKA